ncbi:LysR family transcriptional regulator [Paenibacillus sp. NFR01]|uniref:LysR family transcriptional regulator n=1 Tax=Paenibacillus sp. NFR01 TaxID=1566279 RepID=UPI0008C31C59|nr:LysR family transcriptional regulator [Paenibacillus sp. NFR01]SEU10441.1 DNA-binding transcriptional regulator, LysR family [Paenibacillus sp. NFR01]
MQYDALRTFVVLAESQNFTKASELLHISQPSVSLHIKNLESEFQAQLFLRSPKFVQITPSGELLYQRAKQILLLYDQAKEELWAQRHSLQGELVVGASFTIGEYLLPALLAKLRQAYPQLNLRVEIGNTDEIVRLVRLLEVDIGLIEGPAHDKELSVLPFMEDELVIIASKAHHPIGPNPGWPALQDQTWVTREEGSGTREYFNHFIRINGLKIKSLLTIGSNQGVKESVIQGMGLSLLSRHAIERELAYGELAVIELKPHRFMRTLSYVTSPIMKNKRSVEALIEVLQKI